MATRKQYTFYFLIRTIAYIVSKLYFRLDVLGQDNIKHIKGSFILASNHQSYLDPIVLSAASARPLMFIARQDLFRNFIFGKFISNLGAVPVNLERLTVGLVKKIYRLFKSGEAIIIFPEGTRSPKDVISKARPGIGYLVDKTKVCVVPTFIQGSSKAWSKHSLWPKPYKIRVIFGRAIEYNSLGSDLENMLPKDRYRQIASIIMDRIKSLSMRLV